MSTSSEQFVQRNTPKTETTSSAYTQSEDILTDCNKQELNMDIKVFTQKKPSMTFRYAQQKVFNNNVDSSKTCIRIGQSKKKRETIERKFLDVGLNPRVKVTTQM